MRRIQRSPEIIIRKVREAEIFISQRNMVEKAAKQIGVTEQTLYRPWEALGGLVPYRSRDQSPDKSHRTQKAFLIKESWLFTSERLVIPECPATHY